MFISLVIRASLTFAIGTESPGLERRQHRHRHVASLTPLVNARRKIKLVEKERVRIDDLNLERVHACRGKVDGVERHDAGGIRSNRSSEDVAIFGIAGQSLDERGIARDTGIRERAIHLCGEPLNVALVNPRLDQVSMEFLNDVGRPKHPVEAPLSEAQQRVPQMSGVDHARIEHDCERYEMTSAGGLRRRCPFVHLCLVSDLDHTVEGSATVDGSSLAIGQHVGQSNPSMTSRLLEGDLARLEELHERGPADTEQLGRLLGGQPLMNWGDRYGLAAGHRFYNTTENFEDLRRKYKMLTVRSGQRGGWLSAGTAEHFDELVERLGRRQDCAFKNWRGHLGAPLQTLIVQQNEKIARARL